jgi:Xaa-Pro aminopeptidase
MRGYETRISILQHRLQEIGLCGAILFYSRDVLYYTGTAQPSYLVILPQDYFLFVRSGIQFALNEVSIPKEKVKKEHRIESIYEQLFSNLAPNSKIGVEMDILSARQFDKFKKIFHDGEFTDISPMVLRQRKKKDESEVERIKRACQTIDAGHKAILSVLKEGITELELAAAVESAHRLAGHEGIFFVRQPDFFMSRGPIASGSNLFRISGVVYTITGVGLSPSVPAGPSRREISPGDLVIVDIPTLVDGYHADQTRTYILGKASNKIKTFYKRDRRLSHR